MGEMLTEKERLALKGLLVEYRKVLDTALAEYRKVLDTALAEYRKVRDTALAEYRKVRDATWAEYDKVRDAAWAEYRKVCDATWAEYDKVCDTVWAEYDKVCDAAWASLGHYSTGQIVAWVVANFSDYREEALQVLCLLSEGVDFSTVSAHAKKYKWCDAWVKGRADFLTAFPQFSEVKA